MNFEPKARLKRRQQPLMFSATVSRFSEYHIIIVTPQASAKQPNGIIRRLLTET
jgi:hypothetical protein